MPLTLADSDSLDHWHCCLDMMYGVQVMQAKKQLLDKLHADVAAREDLPLKRMLSEDDATMKRREQCQTRVQLLKKAAEEIASVSF